jgi:hypothetical protein
MRHARSIVGLALALAIVAPSAAGATSSVPTKRYAGETSTRGSMVAGLREGPAGNTRLRYLGFIGTLTCEVDHTTTGFGIVFSWFHGPVLVDRMLSIDEVDPDFALHVHGRFGSHMASGDLMFSVPAFTSDEQPQTCTTGPLTWTMRRLRSHSRSAPNLSGADGTLRIRIGARGDARVRMITP